MSDELKLFADYHQIHVFDEGSVTDLGEVWTEEAMADQLAVAGDAVAVGTMANVFVRVAVEVLDEAPADDSTAFDHVVEGSVQVPSGRLVVMGCTDFEPDAARFAVPTGWLRLRVAKSNLGVASRLDIDSDEDPATMELVRVQVWPAAAAPLVVLKQWPTARA
ncbi:hypothetical protein AB0K15_46990 [Amycolatopsis sp. NPDC049253]|uniref:hypothetical protein n=1 Tax=Amycolatopsis sp. NPDC049253 TaxID=3155274 RepID=UPI0034314C41